MQPSSPSLSVPAFDAEKAALGRWAALSVFWAVAAHFLAAVVSPPYAPVPYRLPESTATRLLTLEPDWIVPTAPRPIERPEVPAIDVGPDAAPEVLFPMTSPFDRFREPAPAAAVGPPTSTTAQEETPRLLHAVPPEYPDLARASGAEGKVVLRLTLDLQGRVIHAEVLEADAISSLVDAALAAVRGWLFSPARQGGRPVSVQVVVPIRFVLD